MMMFDQPWLNTELKRKCHKNNDCTKWKKLKDGNNSCATARDPYKKLHHDTSHLLQKAPMRYTITSWVKAWKRILIDCSAVFHQMLTYIKADAVIITETKLKKDINTAEVIPSDPGYTVYRRYRNDEHLSGGGGALLLIKFCYTSTEVTPEDINQSCELMWFEVELIKESQEASCVLLLLPSRRRICWPHWNTRFFYIQSPVMLPEPINLSTWEETITYLILFWISYVLRKTLSKNPCMSIFSLSCMTSHYLNLFWNPLGAVKSRTYLCNIPSLAKSIDVIPGLSDHEAVVTDCCFHPGFIKHEAVVTDCCFHPGFIKIPPRKVHLSSKADWDQLCREAQELKPPSHCRE